MPLRGKIAIVTGASRGIGKAIALRLADEGADVVLVATNQELLERVSAEIEPKGVRCRFAPVDIRNAVAVENFVDQLTNEWGRIDILVNNAGITKDALLLRMSEADWQQVLEVNLKGAFLFTRACARTMLKQRAGTIINISSVVGLMGNPGQTNYVAAKAGLIGFTKACAKELASRGITVNAVAPGFIETDMTGRLSDQARQAMVTMIPLGHTGTVTDVAGAVAFLASDDARYITGQVLQVDGGLLM